MARLMKSELYKKKFFHAVSLILGVELTMKHLLVVSDQLGRDQRRHSDHCDQGFDGFVDGLRIPRNILNPSAPTPCPICVASSPKHGQPAHLRWHG